MKKHIRESVWNKYEKHCSYCGKEIGYKELQVDHYYPQRNPRLAMSYGINVDDIENLMPSCRRCNHYKRALLPESFRNRMLGLHERIEKLYIVKVAIDYGMLKIVPFDGVFYFEKIE